MEWSTVCLVRTNAAALSRYAFDIADDFLDRLVRQCPELARALTWDRNARRRELVEMFASIVKSSGNPSALRNKLLTVAARNERRGIRPHHCETGRAIILGLLSDYNAPGWTPELSRAWTQLLDGVMANLVTATQRPTALAA